MASLSEDEDEVAQMGDYGETGDNEDPEYQLIQRHKKEKKELKVKCQKMKQNAPKKDRQKRNNILMDITRLETELDQKHEKELSELRATLAPVEPVKEIEQSLNTLTTEEPAPVVEDPPGIPKISNSQRKKERKLAAKEKFKVKQNLEQEEENKKGPRYIEAQQLKSILKKRNLTIYEVPSDGNCLYCAIKHQLKLQDIPTSMESLRAQTASYMESHIDDFLPFLIKPHSEDMYSPEEFVQYCNEVANTAAWGGELELRALSHVLKTPIEVIQASGPVISIGEEYKNDSTILLSYHRHQYSMGEHYNSVIPISLDAENEATD